MKQAYQARDILRSAITSPMGQAQLAFVMAKAVSKLRFIRITPQELALTEEVGMYLNLGRLRTGERIIFIVGGRMVRPALDGYTEVGTTPDGGKVFIRPEEG